ncbi:MASE1 domain-containing protein [Bordetella sp. BOR01]|uniref:MASE1 domain-containing protein n=1 Tax=Bordetella sp. BOR01 TaxID=2854779 RepID=UPI001C44855D|nr:MASE1 domain-containing protein [Bordetella sp. BOR01]MBV7486862.1 MASE1 domain-containing protein [Bordetella sp. BOR01]
MASSLLRFALSLLLWAALYAAGAYVSLQLNDPDTRVAFIWLPAGVAVSAFLLTPLHRWPAMFVAFMVARLSMDAWQHHDFLRSISIGCISVAADASIAWLVRRYARRGDDLYGVQVLIGATLLVSAAAAVLGVGWLAYLSGLSFLDTVWIWWAANVTGVLLPTIAILSWTDVAGKARRPGAVALLCGAAAWVLLCASAWYVFAEISPSAHRAALVLPLACAPILLAAVMSMAWGSRGGALGLISLGAIALYYAADERGPFFPHGLQPGESLLLAQCYLSITALLLAFLWVYTNGRRPGGAMASADAGIMYQYDPASGRLAWDGDPQAVLGLDTAPLRSLDELLGRVHPDDRDALKKRWAAAAAGPVDAALGLRVAAGTGWVQVVDRNPTAIGSDHGVAVVGTWQAQQRWAWR